MTELEFIKEIVFKKYPARLAFLVCSELLGAVLVVMGIGAIIPLLGSLAQSRPQMDGNIGKLIDFLGLSEASTIDIMAFLIFILFGRTVIDIIRTYIAGNIAIDIGFELRRTINQKILQYDWSYLQKSDHGMYIQIITTETEMAKSAINDLASVIANTLLFGCMGLSLIVFSPYASLILLPMALIYHIIASPMMKKSHRLGEERVEKMGLFNNTIIDNNALMKLIKAEGIEEERISAVNTIITTLKKIEFKSFIYKLIVDNLGNIFAVIVIAILSYYYLILSQGNGTALLFNLMLIQRCVSYLSSLQTTRRRMIIKMPGYAKCMELLNACPSSMNKLSRDFLSPEPSPVDFGRIDFKKVSYTYEGNHKAINNITLSFPPQGLVGVIGQSGSGKTTLADIILGLLSPQSGRILVHGEPLNTITPQSWQKILAYVPQDAYLFGGTLRENLTMGISDTPDEDIWQALEKANCHQFVNKLPLKLDSPVRSSGRNFSGGERQRLNIARAILRKSRILVMDEPSSALDVGSEEEIVKTINQLKNDMLIIVITHSLNFLSDMDKIYILSAGKCVWEGSYEATQTKNKILEILSNSNH